jgi:thiol-disulfide isomerase/thioredoxin
MNSLTASSMIRRFAPQTKALARALHGTVHPLAVTKISDEDALSKFTQLNSKSILYFTATWCPPCKMISPIYEKLSHAHPDVGFAKIDVDDNSVAAMEFNVGLSHICPAFFLTEFSFFSFLFSFVDSSSTNICFSPWEQDFSSIFRC